MDRQAVKPPFAYYGGKMTLGPQIASLLAARWDERPWHHRLIDIETYAMPILGLARPVGLADLVGIIGNRLGVRIAAPDHTAAQDVRTVRAAWRTLRRYGKWGQR